MDNQKPPKLQFVSLQLKLLVGLTVVYSLVFGLIYSWFYGYSTKRAMEQIQQDLVATLQGTIAGIDPDEFQALSSIEVPEGERLPLNNPLYQKHQEWLSVIHRIEPRANPYTFIPGHKPYEILFIGDFLRIIQPETPTSFREPYIAEPARTRLYRGLTGMTTTIVPYQDQWGSWVSAYGPIKNAQGQVVGGVGVDFRADRVIEVQQGIRKSFAIACGVTYTSLFLLVYIISKIFTRPITELVAATEQISEGDYSRTLSHFQRRSFQDEVSTLATRFESMVEKIRKREEALQDYSQFLEEKVEQRTEELKAKNSQLSTANVELARATRLKDEFLANMSHELRTPLNAILGLTEGLQDQIFGPVNSQQAAALLTIERSGGHLLELINDILDIAKIEAGQLQLEFASVAVAPLCQSSLAFIKQQALAKQIQLEIKLPLKVPKLFADERRLRQILINLLSNAVKFTPEGGHIALEVTHHPCAAGEEAPDNFLEIAVIDTGIGIDPEHLHQLFKPFIQIDAALNRKQQGTGLGLALVKRLVELHGGQVGVVSEPGAGSCFTVRLPYSDSSSSAATLEEDTGSSSQLNQAKQNTLPVVLLAEDNEANANTLSSYLRTKGYRFLFAKDGAEALSLVRSHRPDLVLMDIHMPGMDGLEAIRQIRCDSSLSKLPIIVLTALAMAGDREKCLEAGADEYLTKPVSLKHLASLMASILNTSAGAES